MSKKCKSTNRTISSRSKGQCTSRIDNRDLRARNISWQGRVKLQSFVTMVQRQVKSGIWSIFPCLYTHQVTAYGFLHFYMSTWSTLPFPAHNLPLPLTSLLKNMPKFTFDAVAWSVYHVYATPLPPSRRGSLVYTYSDQLPSVARGLTRKLSKRKGLRWNAWWDTFFLVQTETEKCLCSRPSVGWVGWQWRTQVGTKMYERVCHGTSSLASR